MKKTIPLLISLILLLTPVIRAEEYNLEQFLNLVEQHSKDLKLAKKDVSIAGAEKNLATSGALPHISANAGYNRNLSEMYMYFDMGALSGEDGGGMSKIPATRNNEYSANVALGQTIFSGTVFNAIKAAKQYQKLTNYIYDASYQEIMTFAKKAFHQTLLLKVVWAVSQASEHNAQENYLNVKQAYENGLASEFDLLQAEVRYKDYVPRTTEAERNYNIALINLKNLAGIPVETSMELSGSLDEYPDLPDMATMETILNRRPDFNALLWEEKLRNTNVSAEKSAYLPTVTGSLVYTYSAQSDEWKLEEENDGFILGLNLSLPIFTGGANRAKVQKAKIELDKTRIQIDKSKEDIERELESIRLRLDEAHNRIASAEATLKTAQKAFGIAEATTKAGLTTQLELKDSRVMLDQATTGYYSAVYEYLDAFFDWEKAVGAVNNRGL